MRLKEQEKQKKDSEACTDQPQQKEECRAAAGEAEREYSVWGNM